MDLKPKISIKIENFFKTIVIDILEIFQHKIFLEKN